MSRVMFNRLKHEDLTSYQLRENRTRRMKHVFVSVRNELRQVLSRVQAATCVDSEKYHQLALQPVLPRVTRAANAN